MAVTRRAVERRLGVDPDRLITYFFVCDKCWDRHPMSELNDLQSPACTIAGCDGTLYKLKEISNQKTKRVPAKLLPTMKLESCIRRLLARPGKYQMLRRSLRHIDDHDPDASPLALPPPDSLLDAFPNGDVRLRDISDGCGLRSLAADLVRKRVPKEESGDRVKDTPKEGRQRTRRFISLPCGLVLMINIDWFQPMKKSGHGQHSTGAIYVMLANNSGALRFLPAEMFLVAILPGPDEPTTEQLNKVIQPLVDELLRLYNGVDMPVHGMDGKQCIHCALYMNISDLPASRKISGMRGHTSEEWMCTWCKMTMASLTHSRCFDPAGFSLRSDWRYLKYAYHSQHLSDAQKKEVWEKRGVQWSELDRLPGWMPSVNSPLDLLHGGFLAFVKHIIRVIWIKYGLLNARRGDSSSPLQRFEDALSSIVWPSDVSRVPSKEDGKIPHRQAPLPRSSTNASKELTRLEALYNSRRVKDMQARRAEGMATDEDVRDAIENPVAMDRSVSAHYDHTLSALTALRAWSQRDISPNEAQRAEHHYVAACKGWASIHALLTPYFHLLGHTTAIILRYGPLPSFWLFGCERANGKLTKFRTNNRDGGELEATLMRCWTKTQLVHELLQTHADVSELDRDAYNELKECIDGEGSKSKLGVHQALVDMLAARAAEQLNTPSPGIPAFRLSPQSKAIRLQKLGLYNLAFEYVRELWKDTVHLVPLSSVPNWRDGEEAFGDLHVRSYHYVCVNGRQFGAYNSFHGRGRSNVFIDGRQATRVQRILRIEHVRAQGAAQSETLSTTVAVVSRFRSDPRLPMMPWDTRGVDPGIYTWLADDEAFASFEIIPVERLTGHFALMPIPLGRDAPWSSAWATISTDRWGQEPEPIVDFDDNIWAE
ncbi:unnamed protein product [Peniophora sp. CBMAI 1063]|nr:unnamed protein product [Peniophora sp. CBMAI 1063]